MIHGVGRETRRRIVVAVAALDSRHRDVRRRLHTGRGGAVVAVRAIGIGGRVSEFPPRPAGEGRRCAGVTGDAVAAIGRDMAGEGSRTLRALGPLTGERAVMAGVTPAGADGCMAGHAHRIGRKARRRVGMAVAALDSGHRNVRRRCQAGRGGAIVAVRAIGIGCRVAELSARPAGEGRGHTGVASDTVAAIGHDMAGKRSRTLSALGAFTCE